MGRPVGSLGTYTCSVCGTKERAKGGSHHFKCVSCKKTEATFSEYSFNCYDRGGWHAMGLVASAIRGGRLEHPSTKQCLDCGERATEYDHRDYNKPLEVDPVCRPCNHRRGPAIPARGYFTLAFEQGRASYRQKKATIKLLSLLGLSVNPESLPGTVSIEHWLPYREQLLAFDSKPQPQAEAV